MLLDKVALADTHAFSTFFLDYIEQKESLKPFYNRYPSLENFEAQIAEKSLSFPLIHRQILSEALQKQYDGLTLSNTASANLRALKKETTFTVTTGHQLNIFTGPLYFIFKIVTVINACKTLKVHYPHFDFVPIYWMASEDHDYDEIKYFKLDGKKYVWETDQTGAVGRFDTDGLLSIATTLPGDFDVFKDAYSKGRTLSEAVRYYVNELFGKEGVLVLDADARELKTLFRDLIQKDILEQGNKSVVDATNEQLQNLGYKTQVFCRDINFFYLDRNIRARIEKQDDRFKVIDTPLSFSAEEIRKLIDEQPEKFSPNVILRPLYQEVILPNIAYVGGPAEIIYWLQLKEMFSRTGIPFPFLMPRNFGMVVPHEISRKFSKIGLDLKDLFEEKNYLFNHWLLKHSARNLTVGVERIETGKIFDQLQNRASLLDQSLVAFVAAQGKRALNGLERIERKFIRAEKRRQADKLRQIEDVKNALFPENVLQERTDNFLNFYLRDPHFIRKLIDNFDPFDFDFNILRYNS